MFNELHNVTEEQTHLRGDRRARPRGGEIRLGGLKRLMSCTSAGGPHGPPRGERCRLAPTGERERGATNIEFQFYELYYKTQKSFNNEN